MKTDFEHYPDVEVTMVLPEGMASNVGVSAGTWSLEFIDPETAMRYLEDMSWNRDTKTKKILRYAQSISEGKWRLTHQGIAFDEDGKLCDGQHRLHAIVHSGRGIWIWVYRGIQNSDKVMMDRGYLRTDKVLLEYATGHKMTNRQIALARALIGTRVGMAPEDLLAESYSNYKESIDWADKTFGAFSKSYIRSPVIEALVRARFHEPHKKIERFCEILKEGITSGPHESAAVKLREFLFKCTRKRMTEAEMVKLRAYAESAIKSFCRGEPVSRLSAGVDRHQTANGTVTYTLPGEKVIES